MSGFGAESRPRAKLIGSKSALASTSRSTHIFDPHSITPPTLFTPGRILRDRNTHSRLTPPGKHLLDLNLNLDRNFLSHATLRDPGSDEFWYVRAIAVRSKWVDRCRTSRVPAAQVEVRSTGRVRQATRECTPLCVLPTLWKGAY